jgi:hypothetical protein
MIAAAISLDGIAGLSLRRFAMRLNAGAMTKSRLSLPGLSRQCRFPRHGPAN